MSALKQSTPQAFVPSEGVRLVMVSDIDAGRYLDTNVRIAGEFCIAGADREQFAKELGALIDRYRI